MIQPESACIHTRVVDQHVELAERRLRRLEQALHELRDRRVPKSTLSQHFKALREAGLIMSERRGVEMHNTARCAEIDERFPGLLPAILKAHQIQSTRARTRKRGKRRA